MIKTKWMIVAAVIVLLGLTYAFVIGQEQSKGRIVVSFLDENGKGVEGATVTGTDKKKFSSTGDLAESVAERVLEQMGGKPDILTDKNGRAEIAGLSPGMYEVMVMNTEPNPFAENQGVSVRVIDTDRHVFRGSSSIPSLSQEVELKESESEVEVKFQLSLAVKLKGIVKYEDDGAPAEGVMISSRDGYGTDATTEKNGAFLIKGVQPHGELISLRLNWFGQQGAYAGLYTDVNIKNVGDRPVELNIFRVKAEPRSMEGSVSIDGMPYKMENNDAIIKKGITIGLRGHIDISIENDDEGFTYGYGVEASRSTGLYSIGFVKPCKYKLKVIWLGSETKEGPIKGETEVAVKSGEILKMDVEIVTQPSYRVNFHAR